MENIETLMRYNKKELAERVIIAEHNNEVMKTNFEIQYLNCMNIVKDMNLLNDIMRNKNDVNVSSAFINNENDKGKVSKWKH